MKKGFTLIELIAVIAIIGLLATIAIPNVMNVFTNKKEELYNNTVKELEKVSRTYLIDNPNLYNEIDSVGYADITITMLCSNRYLSCPVLDPRDSSTIEGYIRVRNVGNGYDYAFTRSN